MKKQRRWILSAIEASKSEDATMPWQRSIKLRPQAFKHIQMQVPPRPQAAAAR